MIRHHTQLQARLCRCLYVAILILASGIGLAGCGLTINQQGGVICNTPTNGLTVFQQTELRQEMLQSPQCDYQALIIADRKALFPGWVRTGSPISIPLGQPYVIAASVCGNAAPPCVIQLGNYPEVIRQEPEPASLQGKLEVGGRIRATLAGFIPGGIQDSYMDDVQLIIARSDSATWRWIIQPTSVGVFNLTLTLTVLVTTTNSPLVPGVSFPIQVRVTASNSQKVTAVLSSGGKFLKYLAGLLAALFGCSLGAIVLGIYKRMKQKGSKDQKGPAAKTPPAEAKVPSLQHGDNDEKAAHDQKAASSK